MVKKVKYKRPRKINPVSVSIVTLLLLICYSLYRGGELLMLRMETERVVKRTGVEFNSKRGFYLEQPEQLTRKADKLRMDVMNLGVQDPKTTEHWIDITNPDEILIGVYYLQNFDWPFDLAEPHVFEIQQEVRCPPPNGSQCTEMF